MKAVEIAQLLRSGVRVTVNSDDPAYFGGYVVDNYLALATEADLTSAEVVTLAENSFVTSWIDDDRRAGYLADISRFVEQF
jgi:adenosine deaminase